MRVIGFVFVWIMTICGFVSAIGACWSAIETDAQTKKLEALGVRLQDKTTEVEFELAALALEVGECHGLETLDLGDYYTYAQEQLTNHYGVVEYDEENVVYLNKVLAHTYARLTKKYINERSSPEQQKATFKETPLFEEFHAAYQEFIDLKGIPSQCFSEIGENRSPAEQQRIVNESFEKAQKSAREAIAKLKAALNK